MALRRRRQQLSDGVRIMRILTHDEVELRATRVAFELQSALSPDHEGPVFLYGVPRGGVPAALAVQAAWNAAFGMRCRLTPDPVAATAIIDDLIDSGTTRERFAEAYPSTPFLALLDKQRGGNDGWIVFPWEGDEQGSSEDIPRRLLQFIEEDPSREGLRDTPARFLRAWQHYTKGYHEHPRDVLKSFEDGAANVDEIVLVRDIPVYSHCEHHLAPFFGVAHVGYIPNGKVVGLSKLARLVDIFARRLQVQERLTTQIAYALQEHLACRGVGVIIECRHLCMEARGARVPGATTKTSCMLGGLRDVASARAEFLELIR